MDKTYFDYSTIFQEDEKVPQDINFKFNVGHYWLMS